jgi:hypothetical protein
MKSVSIIACNNGFGHIKRCCLIYSELIKLGIKATIVGNAERIKSFLVSRGNIETFNIQNFEGLPSGQDYLNNEQILKGSLVISDNYYEPFLNGESGFLLANFLWSDLEGKYVTHDILKQLNKTDCTILTTTFAKNYLQGNKKINLFGKMKEQSPALGYTLICKGLGDWSGGFEERLEAYLEIEYKKNLGNTLSLLIDTSIPYLSCFSHYNFKFLEEGITTKIIAGSDQIVGRPSIGIVTDALSNSVPFIPVYALTDSESVHNSFVLSELYKSKGINTENSFAMREMMKQSKFDLNGENQLAKLVQRELMK